MRRAIGPAVLAVLAATLLVGCGESDSEPEAGGTESLSLFSTSSSPAPAPSAGGGRDEIGGSVTGKLGDEPKVVVPKGKPPSRLLTKDIVKGDGEVAGATSGVTVRYVAMFYETGEKFDSSWDLEEKKSTFSLTSVIVGFAQGLAGMRVGGRREIVVPPSLGYGAKGSEEVPPNSTLVFVVDLLDVT